MSRIVVEMTGDEAKLWKAQAKILAQQRAMEGGYEKVARKSKDAGQAAEDAFRGGAGGIRSFISGMNLAAAAANGVTSALEKMAAARNEAQQRSKEAAPDLGELLQLDNPKQRMANAREIFRSGGAETLGEAGRIEFALNSAGAEDFRDEAISTGRTGLFRDVPKFIESLHGWRQAFGEEETGDLENIASKALGGGKIATGSVDELLQGANRAAAPGAALGLSDEEIMAGTATLSGPLGSAEQAGTVLNSLLTAVANKGGYEGKSLREIVGAIKQREMDFPELKELLGRDEAIRGIDILMKQGGTYDEALKAVNQAQKEGLFDQKIAEGEEIFKERIAEREQRNRKEDAETNMAKWEDLADAVSHEQKTRSFEKYGDGFIGQARNAILGFGDYWADNLLGGKLDLQLRNMMGGIDKIEDPDLKRQVQEALRQEAQPAPPEPPARPRITDGAGIGYSAPDESFPSLAAPMHVTADSPALLTALHHIAGTLDAILARGSSGGPRTPAPVSSRGAQLQERQGEIA